MAFRDLDEFLVSEPIVLPVRGKEYVFPGPGDVSADLWLRLQKLNNQMQQIQAAQLSGEPWDPDLELVSDTDQQAMMNEMLGGVEQQMIEDGLTAAHIQTVFYTLIAWHLSGEEAAEAVWNAQGKVMSPNRAERRGTVKSRRSRASQGASTATVRKGKTSLGTKSSSGGS